MGKGPGLFSDIGKKAKDLLIKDYNYDQKFTVTSSTADGLTFSSTGINKGGLFIGDVDTLYKHQNATFNVKVNTDSSIATKIAIDDIIPNTKTIFNFKFPDEKSGKLEFQYLHEHLGLCSSVGLTSKPLVDVSAAVGTEAFSIGGEVGYDTASGELTKYNAGIGITKPEFSASVIFTDKAETLKASYIHEINSSKKAYIAGEIARNFPLNQNTFTVGSSYAFDKLTTMKARLNNHGRLGALLQHEWQPKSLLTLSAEVDTKALGKTPKVGLALAYKP